jgi:small multidrug resistance pump
MRLKMFNIILISVYLLLTVSGLVLFKLGASGNASFGFINGTFMLKFNLIMLAGLLCYTLSFIMYMVLISKFNLSYIIPLTTGIVYVLIFAASILIFNEHISVTSIFGAIFVLTGVILLNIKG